MQRTESFQRSAEQETLLEEVNGLLAKAEPAQQDGAHSPGMPMVFVIGSPRSGTTLTMQWLASSGQFAYPSNLLARFYRAPYVGARIQQLLTDGNLDFRNELRELQSTDIDWKSEVGKTAGILQPHEFSYFWRRFFPIDQAQRLSEEQLAGSDPAGFAAGWAAIERAFGKPVAAKGILLQYDLERLAAWLPTAIFLYTRRDPVSNIRSLLRARERIFGTVDAWFSVQPPGHEWLRGQDPYVQVAGQVKFTNRCIEDQLSRLPPDRSVTVDYERFCGNPSALWEDLRARCSPTGYPLQSYAGPRLFESTNEASRDSAEDRRIHEAWSGLA